MREHPQLRATQAAAKVALQPLALAFRAGVVLRRWVYRRGWFRTRRLHTPVISVGNLSVGGTGKTPVVALIAEILARCGRRPAILTRGYGRKRGAAVITIEPGAAQTVDPRLVGDEPALLAARLPKVPIVVAADRYRAGLVAERRFDTDVYILDDGFQHLALARDLDVVLLDVSQDYSPLSLLPAGRLREPLAALSRAQVAVLTRAELLPPGGTAPIEQAARRVNPALKVFRGTTRLQKLRETPSGQSRAAGALRNQAVCAFCGIGNPQAFFRNLEGWGFSVVRQTTFPDHHQYGELELAALARQATDAGAAALLTTEKDAMNFPRSWAPEVPVLACVTEVEVEPAAAFEEVLTGFLTAC